MANDWQYLLPDDQEELLRTLEDRILQRVHVAYPGIVQKSSEDGNIADAKIAVKGQQMDWEKGKVQDVDISTLQGVPIHFIGGGGKDEDSSIITHPVRMVKDKQGNIDEAKSDEGIILMASRAIGNWWQNGKTQPPTDRRRNSMTPMFIPGIRSKPRAYKYHDNEKMQTRSIDKMHVFTHDPHAGMTHRSVQTAQDKDKDPYENPKDFYEHKTEAANGVISRATKGQDKPVGQTSTNATNHYRKTTHDGTADSIGKQGQDDWHTHVGSTTGFKTSVDGGQHTFDVNKDNGIKANSSSTFDISAPTHNVTAETNIKNHNINVDKDVNAQNVKASQDVTATGTVSGALASFGGISGLLNSGGGAGSGIGAGAMQNGAAATNVGALGGDLSGTLPNPSLLIRSVNFSGLPSAALSKGRVYIVNDATTATWRASVTAGGGANVVMAWSDGTNWLVMG